MNRNMLKWAVGSAALALSFAAQAAGNGVVVSVAPEKAALGKSDDVLVKVTFTNTSGSPQYILKSHTPFDGVTAPLFDVARDGVPVRYLGAVAKRPAPTAADYYLLKPGASYSVKVELSALYDMATTGDYKIRFRASSAQLFADGAAVQASAASSARVAAAVAAGASASDALESDAATVWIDGARPRGAREQTRSLAEMQAESLGTNAVAAAASLSYSQCSASQQSTVSQALAAAQTMANNADAYMSAGTTGTRYTKWFGAVNSSRVATIKSHYAAIKSALATKPITVNCGCTDTSYAYVYPTQPYTIYVCKAFWSAPLSGTDSKAGTLVHEMSHFNVVAGTDDWAYGQSAAASLAISNPAKAIDNADSHEYFGENTPALR